MLGLSSLHNAFNIVKIKKGDLIMSAMEIVKYYENKLAEGKRLSEREAKEYDAYLYSLAN